jgi:hypothetical protein
MTKTRTAKIVSRLTTWVLRLMVVLTVLFFVAVAVTATMGGKGDIQRQSLETVAGQALGLQATIHDLRMYRIFPQFYVDLSNFEARRPGDDLPALIIERVLFAQELWPRLLGAPAISTAEFDNLVTRPGVLGPYSLHLSSGRVVKAPDDRMIFEATGDYADQVTRIAVPLEYKNGFVRIDGAAPVLVQIGDMIAHARVQIQKDVILFSDLDVQFGDYHLNGAVVLPRQGSKTIDPIFQVVDSATGARRVYHFTEFNDVVNIVAQKDGGTNTTASPALDALAAYWQRIFKVVRPIDDQGKKMAYPKIQVK